MNKGLVISIAGHLGVLAAVAYLGTLQPAPLKRGYPTLMMATLIQKPMMAQSSGVLASSQPLIEARPIAQPPAPELKPVPSTKIGTTTPEPPKKKEEKKPSPPQPQTQTTTPAGGTGRRGGSVGTGIKIDAPEFPYPHYLVLLQFRIEGNWQPPFSGIGEEITTVYFKITAEGEIENVKIEKSSGNFALDQAALRAVRNANPLPPLPSGSGLETLGVYFDFVAN
jgi:protein TonB